MIEYEIFHDDINYPLQLYPYGKILFDRLKNISK